MKSVPPRAALRIEIADDRGNVGLEEPRPHDDQHQAGEEADLAGHSLPRKSGQSDREMSERDEHGTGHDRAAQAEPSVRNPSAGKR